MSIIENQTFRNGKYKQAYGEDHRNYNLPETVKLCVDKYLIMLLQKAKQQQQTDIGEYVGIRKRFPARE